LVVVVVVVVAGGALVGRAERSVLPYANSRNQEENSSRYYLHRRERSALARSLAGGARPFFSFDFGFGFIPITIVYFSTTLSTRIHSDCSNGSLVYYCSSCVDTNNYNQLNLN
jgi:hypothetical protein